MKKEWPPAKGENRGPIALIRFGWEKGTRLGR